MDKIDYLHPTAIAQIQAVLNGEPVPDNTDNRDGHINDVRYLTPYAVEQIIEAGGSGASSADRVSYDNTESGLTATDVQGAIDETLDKVDAMSAAKVSYDNSTSGLTATTVQSAIDEVGANLGEIENPKPTEIIYEQEIELKDTTAFISQITLPVDIKIGEWYEIEIGGTATRDTNRVYRNTYGKNVTIQNNSQTAKYCNYAEIDITSILYGCKVTAVGTLSLRVKRYKYETKVVRPQILINKSDTQEQIFYKLLNAIKIRNCDVFFEKGNYVFNGIYDIVSSYNEFGNNDVMIGGGCNYYLQGSKISIGYTGTLSKTNFSVFGTARKFPSDYAIYDGILESGCCYCVHDEGQGLKGSYLHKYDNVKMQYKSSESTQSLSKCIGGGAGLEGNVLINNSVFITDNSDSVVSYHGKPYETTEDSYFNVSAYNCYFSNSMRFGTIKDNEHASAIVCGCKGGLIINEDWASTTWNNVN